VFHQFPNLPPELRIEIWIFSYPSPQILHVLYDVYPGGQRWTRLAGYQRIGEWTFVGGLDFPHLRTSRDARRVTIAHGCEIIRLLNDVTKTRWFNYKFDTMFLNTNAPLEWPHKYLPPRHFPIHGNIKTLKSLAISSVLWYEWPFLDWPGSSASCDRCPGALNTMVQFEWLGYAAEPPAVKVACIVHRASVGRQEVEFERTHVEENRIPWVIERYRRIGLVPPQIETMRVCQSESESESQSESQSGSQSGSQSE
jgi:hypothetical protein